MAAQGLDAMVERSVRALGGVGRERPGDERALKDPLGLEQTRQCQAGGNLGAVEQC